VPYGKNQGTMDRYSLWVVEEDRNR